MSKLINIQLELKTHWALGTNDVFISTVRPSDKHIMTKLCTLHQNTQIYNMNLSSSYINVYILIRIRIFLYMFKYTAKAKHLPQV